MLFNHGKTTYYGVVNLLRPRGGLFAPARGVAKSGQGVVFLLRHEGGQFDRIFHIICANNCGNFQLFHTLYYYYQLNFITKVCFQYNQ